MTNLPELNRVHVGDCLDLMRSWPDNFVHTVVTSPPYWGLRDYGVPGQLGLEERLDCLGWATGEKCGDCYICHMVAAFREVRRVLRRMVPARLALALQADGWYLRSDISWVKRNPMPESVRDRPTKAHEYVFLFAKSERYFFDMDAVREKYSDAYINDPRHQNGSNGGNIKTGYDLAGAQNPKSVHRLFDKPLNAGRQMWSWWDIPTQSFAGAHFATFPEELPKRCILAGTSERGCCADCGAPYARVTEKSTGGGATSKSPKRLGHGTRLAREAARALRKITGGHLRKRRSTDGRTHRSPSPISGRGRP